MKQDLIDSLVDYVLNFEYDDFIEHPSDNHIYFKAYSLKYGAKKANLMLKGL